MKTLTPLSLGASCAVSVYTIGNQALSVMHSSVITASSFPPARINTSSLNPPPLESRTYV